MTSSLLDINNTTLEQCNSKQNQPMVVFMLVAWRLTKVRIVRLVGESKTIVHWMYGTELPLDEGMNLATILHPRMDFVFARIRYP